MATSQLQPTASATILSQFSKLGKLIVATEATKSGSPNYATSGCKEKRGPGFWVARDCILGEAEEQRPQMHSSATGAATVLSGQFARLLRAGRKRPRSRRSAEESNEVAPPAGRRRMLPQNGVFRSFQQGRNVGAKRAPR
jgi:hypothetical protein